jgi:sigma-B regulation protein RsbU (phosphoserine phosphatase)
MDHGTDAAWGAALTDLLHRVKLAQPDELAAEVAAAVAPLRVDITIYLADLEQQRLRPLPVPGKPTPEPLSIGATLAGRAFTTVTTHPGAEEGGSNRLWVPMIDGAERLGVADVAAGAAFARPADLRRYSETMVGLVGHLVTVKLPYGDGLHRLRRTRAMSPASELLAAMLPPLTFSTHRMAISAVLEPVYEVGGDAFDYAVDDAVAGLMVFDAMGRGTAAGLTCATALASVRAARRAGGDLGAMADAGDAALAEQFPDLRFVTAILAQLDIEVGVLRYVNAGHPPPLLLRQGRAVRTLSGGRRRPLGIDDTAREVGEEALQPGDRLLLYTDGVTEAYDRQGNRFGVGRLVDLAERCAAAELPAPETLRRLSHSVLEHQDGPPADDATLLLLEWSPEAGRRTQV